MKKAEISRSKNISSQSRLFFIPKARKDFIELRQAFIEAQILNHFDLKHHISIETDASSYAIVGIFNQLTLDDLS